MIGIFSLITMRYRRPLANLAGRANFALAVSTLARKYEYRTQGVYPRSGSLYTFRTPSPGGSLPAILHKRPANFFSGLASLIVPVLNSGMRKVNGCPTPGAFSLPALFSPHNSRHARFLLCAGLAPAYPNDFALQQRTQHVQ